MKNIQQQIILLAPGLFLWLPMAKSVESPPGVGVPISVVESDQQTYSLAGSVAVSNRYVTEGINNVPDTPFYFSEVNVGYHGFTLGVWYAEAFSDAYNEVNLYADYTVQIRLVDIYGGVNFLLYPSDAESSSWELYLGMEWELTPWVALFAETFYDMRDVKGGFAELGVVGQVPLLEDYISFNPYVLYGLDYGFVSDSRKLRNNNIQIGVELNFFVTANFRVFGNANHSFALFNLDRMDEADVSWVEGGVGVEF